MEQHLVLIQQDLLRPPVEGALAQTRSIPSSWRPRSAAAQQSLTWHCGDTAEERALRDGDLSPVTGQRNLLCRNDI